MPNSKRVWWGTFLVLLLSVVLFASNITQPGAGVTLIPGCSTCTYPSGAGALLGTYPNTSGNSATGVYAPIFANGAAAQAGTVIRAIFPVGGYIRSLGTFVESTVDTAAYARGQIVRNFRAGVTGDGMSTGLFVGVFNGDTTGSFFSGANGFIRVERGDWVNGLQQYENLGANRVDGWAAEFITDNGSVIFGARPSSIAACAAGTDCFDGPFNNESLGTQTEASQDQVLPFGGTFQNLWAQNNGTQPGTGSCVGTVRLNGANTGITLTIAAGAVAGPYKDTTNTAAFVAGDRFTLNFHNNAAIAACAIIYYSLEAVPTTSTDRFIGGHVNATLGLGATSFSFPMGTAFNATEARVEYAMPRAGTIRDCFVRMSVAGAGGATVTFTMRKNEVDTAQTISVGSGTLQASDTVNSFTVVQGDRVDAEFTQGGAGVPGTIASWGCRLTP